MGYVEELKGIPELAAIGEALASYAKSLIPGADFVKKGRQWVCTPNFMAFEIQAARAKHITFTIYGLRYKFEKYRALPLGMARSSYLTFVIDSPRQLGPAASYIANAARAYAKKNHRPGLAESIGQLWRPHER